MTGFGKTEFEIHNKKVTIEIKSLNSKQMDISSRIPQLYREKEIELRRDIADALVRGKVDYNIFVDNKENTGNTLINQGVVRNYFTELSGMSIELGLPVNESLLQIIMRLPDSVKVNHETLDDEEWKLLKKQNLVALERVNDYRIREGKALETDLNVNLEFIMRLLKDVEPFENKRIDNVKTHLTDNLEALRLNGSYDPNRFEQELIYYLEKLDFNEEKIRLANHCVYFLEIMKENESNGRKLSFIAQEMGREINTLGSKANDSDIQRIVVQMKDALERIKEQVFNIL